MPTKETIALDCPYCRETIYRPLSWFKQAYATCPECQGGLSASQFAERISEIEQTLDATIEEMVQGEKKTGCCCKKKH